MSLWKVAAVHLAVLIILAFEGLVVRASDRPSIGDIDAAPHFYKTRPLRDRFTRLMPELETLDRSSEKAFLISLLKKLEVPVSSQMLVFSTTSLQLSLISPSNPRAIYFNEDIYVGYIPGGKIEIVSLDPELGGIFYMFEIPRGDRPIAFDRSNRCVNCHVGEDTKFVPGIVIKSVVAGPGGGSLDSFRDGLSGHDIPLSDRFGGWHITGKHGITNHWGNLTGRYVAGSLTRLPNEFGKRFNVEKYPVATSDVLPHLLHEHQAGFVNRVTLAAYLARENHSDAELDEQARIVTRYILFADEAPLPGIEGDTAFKEEFRRHRRTVEGASLKDFDLDKRLFKHRCSYMIYSPIFEGLPAAIKTRIYKRLQSALAGNDPDFAYLAADEKRAIQKILKATLADY